MKTMILAAAAVAATLVGGAAMAQPYGYAHNYDRGGYGYDQRGYDNYRGGYAERGRDRERRDRWAWERHHRHYHHDWRYDRGYRW
jgi:hypothetical protein